jgi:hypothetical protein
MVSWSFCFGPMAAMCGEAKPLTEEEEGSGVPQSPSRACP